MALSVDTLLAAARAQVKEITPAEAQAALQTEPFVLVDIRDIRELEREGMIEGAHHAPRGMLEFWIDPASPYHKPYFAQDKTFIFYCASGWRSLLAAQTAQNMGLKAQSLEGGFSGWKEAGFEVSARAKR